MKGIIFNLLGSVVTQEYGEDAWDALIEKTGVDGAYTSLGSYPHEQLVALVQAASETYRQPVDDVFCWFGRKAFRLLAQAYPQFVREHRSTRPFLLTLNSLIHPEVRKLYPNAEVPDFEFDTSSESVLVVKYRSAKRLCSLAEGLMQGAASYFAEEAVLDHSTCLKRGASECIWNVTFKPGALSG